MSDWKILLNLPFSLSFFLYSTSTEKQEGKVNSVTANLDKEKNIAFLLNELDVLRANNKKVQPINLVTDIRILYSN